MGQIGTVQECDPQDVCLASHAGAGSTHDGGGGAQVLPHSSVPLELVSAPLEPPIPLAADEEVPPADESPEECAADDAVDSEDTPPDTPAEDAPPPDEVEPPPEEDAPDVAPPDEDEEEDDVPPDDDDAPPDDDDAAPEEEDPPDEDDDDDEDDEDVEPLPLLVQAARAARRAPCRMNMCRILMGNKPPDRDGGLRNRTGLGVRERNP